MTVIVDSCAFALNQTLSMLLTPEHKPGSVNEGDLFTRPRSGVFALGLLLGGQALHELGSFLVIRKQVPFSISVSLFPATRIY